MKKIVIGIVIMLASLSATVKAYDHPKFHWIASKNFGHGITLKSTEALSFSQIQLLKNTFDDTETRFFPYYNISRDSCEYGPLDIRVVKDYSVLNNKAYFPNLDKESYAGPGERIFGRYFRDGNILYIIAPRPYVYDWKHDFAHELLHYFFDDCGRVVNGAKIINNDDEHRFVNKFLDVFKLTFP